ncbi:hypothetical protein LTR78_009485 [Recurvomyces mirabilis]|uniref:Uncharacterized protein n=1 Tax=Recurvomyces mirabilis TaxID=574656 RepID=A0AAE0TN69_9PEZI|nr:hypothetical protein LTR78_009485 [Recurvomyces mirabilis]KAK5152389.1 hypothetical protein LTS14_008336 [Recurvomyces mirabilis]
MAPLRADNELSQLRIKGRAYDRGDGKARRQISTLRTRIDDLATAILLGQFSTAPSNFTPKNVEALDARGKPTKEWQKLYAEQDRLRARIKSRSPAGQIATTNAYYDLAQQHAPHLVQAATSRNLTRNTKASAKKNENTPAGAPESSSTSATSILPGATSAPATSAPASYRESQTQQPVASDDFPTSSQHQYSVYLPGYRTQDEEDLLAGASVNRKVVRSPENVLDTPDHEQKLARPVKTGSSDATMFFQSSNGKQIPDAIHSSTPSIEARTLLAGTGYSVTPANHAPEILHTRMTAYFPTSPGSLPSAGLSTDRGHGSAGTVKGTSPYAEPPASLDTTDTHTSSGQDGYIVPAYSSGKAVSSTECEDKSEEDGQRGLWSKSSNSLSSKSPIPNIRGTSPALAEHFGHSEPPESVSFPSSGQHDDGNEYLPSFAHASTEDFEPAATVQTKSAPPFTAFQYTGDQSASSLPADSRHGANDRTQIYPPLAIPARDQEFNDGHAHDSMSAVRACRDIASMRTTERVPAVTESEDKMTVGNSKSHDPMDFICTEQAKSSTELQMEIATSSQTSITDTSRSSDEGIKRCSSSSREAEERWSASSTGQGRRSERSSEEVERGWPASSTGQGRRPATSSKEVEGGCSASSIGHGRRPAASSKEMGER